MLIGDIGPGIVGFGLEGGLLFVPLPAVGIQLPLRGPFGGLLAGVIEGA